MPTPLTIEERLADARNQLHLLLTGQAARVYVDQNGERVEYVAANAARLQAYIASLEGLLAARPSNGPLRMIF